MVRKNLRVIMGSALLLLACSAAELEANQPGDWIQGSGKDLQIRLCGEVYEPDRQPANDVEVIVQPNGYLWSPPVKAQVSDHRFEVWLRVNKLRLYSVSMRAASADGGRVVYRGLTAAELRRSAIDGIKLTLQDPTRQVEVKVTDEGQAVAGAEVLAELDFQQTLRSRTDSAGVASFDLLPDQHFVRLTAWSNDHRTGGYSFDREPKHDPDLAEYIVELDNCRTQRIRLVDEDNSPVPGISFLLQVATAPPNYNWLGWDERSLLRTNESGEVAYHWLPDWSEHHFGVLLQTDQWLVDPDEKKVDGTMVFQLQKSRIAERKRVRGRVLPAGSAAGVYVDMASFQGEKEDMSDVVSTFTDSDGTFSVNVLPDATYRAYAFDLPRVSEPIDLIPYQSVSKTVIEPQLTLLEGEKIEVAATSGPSKKPYPHLAISFRKDHLFSWKEGSSTRKGNMGQQWWAVTDEAGRAVTYALPGDLKASVYTPLWRTETTVNVSSGAAAKITLHREVEQKQKVTGRLILADVKASDLEGHDIRAGAIDGNFDGKVALKSGNNGEFSFETMASKLGIFASTGDGRAAGLAIINDLNSPVAIHLNPTMEYHGQLLGDEDKPIQGHRVSATVYAQDGEDYSGMFVKSFTAKSIESRTDEQGKYTLSGVPGEMKMVIYADPIGPSESQTYLGEAYLEPGESRPLAVSRLGKRPANEKPTAVAEWYAKTLRDCRIQGYHMMVITRSDNQDAIEFVNQNFVDYERNHDVAGYMQVVLPRSQDKVRVGDLAFLEEHGWPSLENGRIFACALDAHGNELGRLELDVSNADATEKAAKFIHEHLPPQVNAEQKWREAFEEASRSNRRVWARVSGRYCGPCFSFSRWLDEHQALIEKDFVILKIDGTRDAGAGNVAERLTHGRHHGVPFHAIYDTDESMLVDSAGPLGNIGHPSEFEGKKHLRKMLLATRQRLTDGEIDTLIESLED